MYVNAAETLSIFPDATTHHFSATNDHEVYETEDIDRSYLLGSGASLKLSNEQAFDNYGGTEEAAWDHAAIFVRKAKQWIKDARKEGMFSHRAIDVVYLGHTLEAALAGNYSRDRFATQRMFFRRYYTVNHNKVSRKEFTRRLALAFKWHAAAEE